MAPIFNTSCCDSDSNDGSIESILNSERLKLSQVSKMHPYNALWAQLGDLYGAIGSPLRIAKTVVCGNESQTRIIERVLNVLTYFIRCGEIKRHRMYNQLDSSQLKDIIDGSKEMRNKHTHHNLSTQPGAALLKENSRLIKRTSTHMTNLASIAAHNNRGDTSSDNVSGVNIPLFAFDSLHDSRLAYNLLSPSIPTNDVLSTDHPAASSTQSISKGRFQVLTNRPTTSATSKQDVIKDVVFVLGGDNEELVGIKENPYNLKAGCSPATVGAVKKIDKCSHGFTHKRHSGVKFNFEQYPQILANYMKNKNLELNNYDFFEKGLKMELQWRLNYDPNFYPDSITHEEEQECECCARNSSLQTPSNASELEFTSDDMNACHNHKQDCDKHDHAVLEPPKIVISDASSFMLLKEGNTFQTTLQPFDENREVHVLRSSPVLKVIEFPFDLNESQTSFRNTLREPSGEEFKNTKLLPGFMPSLFVGLTNHYISDMVLQVNLTRSVLQLLLLQLQVGLKEIEKDGGRRLFRFSGPK